MESTQPPTTADPAPRKLSALPCTRPILLGLGRLDVLVREARAQDIPPNNSNIELADDVKDELRQEWEEIVYGAMEGLPLRLTCGLCGCIHLAPNFQQMNQQLMDEMNFSNPEDISQDMVEEWLLRMAVIEEVYMEKCMEQYEVFRGNVRGGVYVNPKQANEEFLEHMMQQANDDVLS